MKLSGCVIVAERKSQNYHTNAINRKEMFVRVSKLRLKKAVYYNKYTTKITYLTITEPT